LAATAAAGFGFAIPARNAAGRIHSTNQCPSGSRQMFIVMAVPASNLVLRMLHKMLGAVRVPHFL
jgi:hypothetical protein